MAKIYTGDKDLIAGGVIYRADKTGFVDIPDDVAETEGLIVAPKPKRTYTKKED